MSETLKPESCARARCSSCDKRDLKVSFERFQSRRGCVMMVRYYGWYSNKMRGQRRKREEEAQQEAACESAAAAEQGRSAKVSAAIEIIEHLALKPRRIPSRSWRELIKKVWEVDPLKFPQCHNEMRIVSLINDAQIIEHILRHVGMWVNEVCNHGVRILPFVLQYRTVTLYTKNSNGGVSKGDAQIRLMGNRSYSSMAQAGS